MKYKLGDVCEFVAGTGFPTKYQGKKEGKYPFYKVGDIATNVQKGSRYLSLCNNYVTENDIKEIKGNILPKDTVVFAKIGEAVKLNRRAITTCECLVDNNVMGLTPIVEKVLLDYFFYIMKNIKMEQLAESTTVPSVRKSKLEKVEIEIPTIKNQKEIVKKLNGISQIIAYRKQQIIEFDNLIKSRFVEMFGDPVKNTMSWPIKRLGDLSVQINSGNTPKGGEQVYVEKGITFFRSQNVWKDRLEMKDIAYIDEDTHLSMNRSSLKHGDILMTKTGRINTENSSLGRAALYLGEDDEANVNGHVYFIRLKPGINNKFILRILVSNEYRDHIRNVCVGGIDKRQLNKNHIEDFPIICPPEELVNSYVNFVHQIDKLKVEVQKSLDEAQLLMDSLMQEYFG